MDTILFPLGERLRVPSDGLCGLHALWSARAYAAAEIPAAERDQLLGWLTAPEQTNVIGEERQKALRSDAALAQLNSTELIRLCEHLDRRVIVIEMAADRDQISALTNQNLPDWESNETLILLHCTGAGSGHYDGFALWKRFRDTPRATEFVLATLQRFAARSEPVSSDQFRLIIAPIVSSLKEMMPSKGMVFDEGRIHRLLMIFSESRRTKR
jgi:hypothetical protein